MLPLNGDRTKNFPSLHYLSLGFLQRSSKGVSLCPTAALDSNMPGYLLPLYLLFPLNRTSFFQFSLSPPSGLCSILPWNPSSTTRFHNPHSLLYFVFLRNTYDHLVVPMLYLLICYHSVPLTRRKFPLEQGCWFPTHRGAQKITYKLHEYMRHSYSGKELLDRNSTSWSNSEV